jgi:hypothetical protein
MHIYLFVVIIIVVVVHLLHAMNIVLIKMSVAKSQKFGLFSMSFSLSSHQTRSKLWLAIAPAPANICCKTEGSG